MNAVKYRQILESNLVPFIKTFFLDCNKTMTQITHQSTLFISLNFKLGTGEGYGISIVTG